MGSNESLVIDKPDKSLVIDKHDMTRRISTFSFVTKGSSLLSLEESGVALLF